MNEQTITVPELAKHLGIGVQRTYIIITEKGFPVIKKGKNVLIPLNELQKWLKHHKYEKSKFAINKATKLCGECKHWYPDIERTARSIGCDVLLGTCEKRGIRCERCDEARCLRIGA